MKHLFEMFILFFLSWLAGTLGQVVIFHFPLSSQALYTLIYNYRSSIRVFYAIASLQKGKFLFLWANAEPSGTLSISSWSFGGKSSPHPQQISLGASEEGSFLALVARGNSSYGYSSPPRYPSPAGLGHTSWKNKQTHKETNVVISSRDSSVPHN